MRRIGAVLAAALVLASCATAPPGGARLRLLVVPAYVGPPGTAAEGARLRQDLLAALRRSAGFAVREPGLWEAAYDKALAAPDFARSGLWRADDLAALRGLPGVDAVGLLTLVGRPAAVPPRAVFQVVDLASGDLLFAWSGPAGGLAEAVAGPLAVQDPFLRPPLSAPSLPPFAQTGLDARLEPWWAALQAARTAGDTVEAQRLLLLMRGAELAARGSEAAGRDDDSRRAGLPGRRLAGWTALLAREEEQLRADQAVRALVARWEAAGPGSEADRYAALDEVRRLTLTAPGAAGRPDLAAAYLARYPARDLARDLARPALLPVPGGTFRRGSEAGETDEKPVRRVTVAAFLMARTETTQDEFRRVLGVNPSLFAQGPDAPRRPVERVTWFDAVEYCNRLSELEGLDPVYQVSQRTPASGFPVTSARVTWLPDRNGYRLPTEAEWEWAARSARADNSDLLAGGDDPAAVARTGLATEGPGPVASLRPNRLGLFDLSGNVWEWCWDYYARYPDQDLSDPRGPDQGVLRVGRGGSWHAAPWNARVSARSFDNPGARAGILGFRVARSLSPPSAP